MPFPTASGKKKTMVATLTQDDVAADTGDFSYEITQLPGSLPPILLISSRWKIEAAYRRPMYGRPFGDRGFSSPASFP